MISPSPKPLISIPTRGQVHAETANWILGAVMRMAPNVAVDFVVGPEPLEHLRNKQVHRFLEGDCTHLFLLDSQCVPPPNALERLLAHDLPFVSAPGLVRKDDKIAPMVVNGEQPFGPGLNEVEWVGCAGMLIAREVFESFGPPWFEVLYGDDGLVKCGEDKWFCLRARDQGFEILADLDLVQHHYVETRL